MTSRNTNNNVSAQLIALEMMASDSAARGSRDSSESAQSTTALLSNVASPPMSPPPPAYTPIDMMAASSIAPPAYPGSNEHQQRRSGRPGRGNSRRAPDEPKKFNFKEQLPYIALGLIALITVGGIIVGAVVSQIRTSNAPDKFSQTYYTDPATVALIEAAGKNKATMFGTCTISSRAPEEGLKLWSYHRLKGGRMVCTTMYDYTFKAGQHVTIQSNTTTFTECEGEPRIYYQVSHMWRGDDSMAGGLYGDIAAEFLDCENTVAPVPTIESIRASQSQQAAEQAQAAPAAPGTVPNDDAQ